MYLIIALALVLPQEDLGSSLGDLFASLTEEQKEAALKPYDAKERDAEVFFPGKRPGLLIGELSEKQFELLDGAIKQFLSKDGYALAMKVARQHASKEGIKAYFINFFGDPSKDKAWAFRISEHHLTLVHVHSDPARFGPILLGANPPVLWQKQEEAAIKCFALLSKEEKEAAQAGKGGMSGTSANGKGILIGELSEKAAKAAGAMVDARLSLFSEAQQKKLRRIIKEAGGVRKLRLAFYGEMTKRCADGGRANWKIEGDGFLCDYESSRRHIHMTMRARKEK